MKRVPIIEVLTNPAKYPEEIRDWNFWHEKAEQEFKTSPASAYRVLRSLWKENMDENGGKYGPRSPKLDAYDTAATDYAAGSLDD